MQQQNTTSLAETILNEYKGNIPFKDTQKVLLRLAAELPEGLSKDDAILKSKGIRPLRGGITAYVYNLLLKRKGCGVVGKFRRR